MKRLLRFQQKLKHALLVGAVGFSTIGMNGCDAMYWDEQTSLKQVQSKTEVVVLTTQSPLIYSRSASGDLHGIDFDLLQNFAQHFGLNLKYKVFKDEDAVLQALSAGEGDLAASRFRTFQKVSGFLVGPGYEETYLALYCHQKTQVQNIKDLQNKQVLLLEKDNYQGLHQRLTQLAPGIKLNVRKDLKIFEALKAVQKMNFDCLISESLAGDYHSQQFSQIEKVTALTEPYSLSWLITPENSDLLRLIQSWYLQASRNDEITQVLIRYKNYSSKLDKQDLAKLTEKIKTTLPEFIDTFKKAAAAYRLPWQLVAAVAYQESHWNPDAQSYTGVQGLMQLTNETASFLGVEDRTDPEQSIWGGAKYLRYLIDQTPKHIHTKERLALALAAYNVGWAHLRDAQKLAENSERNPFAWHHLRHILPLLADPEYSANLEYGAARGHETVEFVERVKSFYTFLSAAIN